MAWKTRAFMVAAAAAIVGCEGRTPILANSPPPIGAPTGGLEGTARYEGVYDDHGGIAVQLAGGSTTRQTQTDATGHFAFAGVPVGSYTLTFSRDRYASQSATVSVAIATASVPVVTLSNHALVYASPSLYDQTHAQSLTSLVLTPDRQHLAFVEGGVLKSIGLDGSQPTTVRDFHLRPGDAIDSFDWSTRGLAFAYVASGSSPTYSLNLASDPAGSATVATSSSDLLISPIYSPDGGAIAFLARTSEPWANLDASGSVVASGSQQLAVSRWDLSTGTWTRLAAYPINKAWNYGFGPISWTPSGILFHKPMFCNLQYVAVSGDGLYLLNPATAGLAKLFYYSWYDHCLSTDGQTVYFHSGRTLYGRKVSDPGNYSQGAFPVGYDASTQMAGLVMGSSGDRVYYLSARGIEVMTLLR
jgi:hypothetical protein